MTLYINHRPVAPALGSVRLHKRRSEAAATLTATIYTAPADTYFLDLSIAVGDPVRLLDDEGNEMFLGSIHLLRRMPEQVEITAYDRGIFLTRNQLRGVFCGPPATICAQVANKLGIPLGTVEVKGGWACITAPSGQSAYAILRQAVGEGWEISLRQGKLCVTKSAYMVYVPDPSRILEVTGAVSLENMVNRCEVADRRGNLLASAENAAEKAAYGQMQTVLQTDGSDPVERAKAALTGRILIGEVRILGCASYLCGCAVEVHRPDWGLDGVYAVTAAEHRWEQGQYTTSMELEWIRA